LRAFDALTDRIMVLRDHPLIGVEARPGLRELFLRFGRSAYVVRYRVTDR
jgi:plasmid stabilization system protein ParE